MKSALRQNLPVLWRTEIRLPAAFALLGLLMACSGETPLAPDAITPSQPVPAASDALPSPDVSDSGAAVTFRDDFDGTAIDASRWTVYENGGVVRVSGGQLEMLVGGLSRTFPLLYPKTPVVPADGPFFLEYRYATQNTGRFPAFNFDYFVPEKPGDPGLTQPLFQQSDVEGGRYTNYVLNGVTTLRNLLSDSKFAGTTHVVRLEFDGKENYRLVYDRAEIVKMTFSRRANRLWFGENPNKPISPVNWCHLKLDYLVGGPLTTPKN